MIYLFTGVPGAGKTLHMVSLLLRDKELKARQIYIDGINQLDAQVIQYNALPEGCSGANWHQWLPEKSVIVIDECQRYWRTRPNGARVPDAIQAMETHRHKGIDIYLITQDAKKIDSAIRGLVEVHKHFSESVIGVKRVFEWKNRVGDPNSKADIRAAIVSPYVPDEDAKGLYLSSVQHNDVKSKKSKWIYGLPLMFGLGLLLIGFGVFRGIKAYNKVSNPQVQQEQQTDIANQKNQQRMNEVDGADLESMKDGAKNNLASGFNLGKKSASEVSGSLNESNNHQKSDVLTEQDFKPSIDGQPWTAPIYANHHGKAQIKTMPYPVMCVKSDNKCTCYTEQATPIKGMSKAMCVDFAENGIYNPYKSVDDLYDEQTKTYRQLETSSVKMVQGESESSPVVHTLGGAAQVERFDNNGALARVQ